MERFSYIDEPCENDKVDVLTVAQIAGMQAVKQNALPIPLCSLLTRDKNDTKMQITSKGFTS